MTTTVWKRFALTAILLMGLVPASLADAPSETPATQFEKECLSLALSMERDIAAKDAGFIDRYFNVDECVDRALERLNPPADTVANFRRGVRTGFLTSFAKSLCDASSVRYLRMRREGKEPRFVFRIAPKEGGVNYIELIMGNTLRSGLKVVDLYNHSLGQNFTYTFRHLFLPVVSDASQGWLRQFTGKDAEFVRHFQALDLMMKLNGAGRYAETGLIYAKLPDLLQKEKLFLVLQMQAAAMTDRAAFNAAIDLWRAAYPDEISVDLVAANCYFNKRDHEKAFAALEQFDKAFGGDAFIDVLRGQIYKNQGKLDSARTWARQSVTKNPKLNEGWELLVGVCLTARNYADVAQALNDWETSTQTDVMRVAEGEKLASFARSPAGKDWLAARETKRVSAGRPDGTVPTRSTHKLQGVFYNDSNPSAIVNGRTVFTGDRITGGYRIEKISRQSVTLKSPDGELFELALK